MVLTDLTLLAYFLTGLLGGVHCAGMCGGIVSALGIINQRTVKRGAVIPISAAHADGTATVPGSLSAAASPTIKPVALYNAGRIGMYTLLGGVAGAVGSMAWLMQTVLPVQKSAYLISNVLLLLMGLYVFGIQRLVRLMESLGLPLWQLLRPLATRRLGQSGAANAFVLGAMWGLVPCGMVYAVLSAALVSGSGARGAATMLAFGLGTLPNLFALGLSGQWLARASKRVMVKRCAGLLIMAFGIFGLVRFATMSAS